MMPTKTSRHEPHTTNSSPLHASIFYLSYVKMMIYLLL